MKEMFTANVRHSRSPTFGWDNFPSSLCSLESISMGNEVAEKTRRRTSKFHFMPRVYLYLEKIIIIWINSAIFNASYRRSECVSRVLIKRTSSGGFGESSFALMKSVLSLLVSCIALWSFPHERTHPARRNSPLLLRVSCCAAVTEFGQLRRKVGWNVIRTWHWLFTLWNDDFDTLRPGKIVLESEN